MKELTPEVKRQLARALYRAIEQNVTIAGRGYIRETGNQFFFVNSASGHGKQYIVLVTGERLFCSCPAGEHDLMCKHRALVHATLASEHTIF